MPSTKKGFVAVPEKVRRKAKTASTKGKRPNMTGRALAVTRGKGKKTGLKKQGY